MRPLAGRLRPHPVFSEHQLSEGAHNNHSIIWFWRGLNEATGEKHLNLRDSGPHYCYCPRSGCNQISEVPCPLHSPSRHRCAEGTPILSSQDCGWGQVGCPATSPGCSPGSWRPHPAASDPSHTEGGTETGLGHCRTETLHTPPMVSHVHRPHPGLCPSGAQGGAPPSNCLMQAPLPGLGASHLSFPP